MSLIRGANAGAVKNGLQPIYHLLAAYLQLQLLWVYEGIICANNSNS